ncbi:MAG: hypothetical protein IPJ20_23480 [Flammeovirgaceae bacterium]|nr:hypothetical protein [Flammeovirgaceae bacterium]
MSSVKEKRRSDGATVAGTGGSLSWARSDAGSYTVVSVSSGCNINMAGTAYISVGTLAVGGSISPAVTNVYGATPNVLLTLSGYWLFKLAV